MITVDLTSTLTDFEGTPLKNENGQDAKMATLVSHQLIQRQESKDPVGDYEIAKELYQKGAVSLTSTQLTTLKDLIRGTQTLTVLAKGQILKVLENLKEDENDETK